MEVEFGFVPKQVVADLQDIGNWKSRASAIDNLHKALHDVGDKSQLLPGLPRFVAFLVTLVADPNFKIAISSMQILSDLVGIAGPDIEPHLRSIIPNLVEKFTDSKALVRSANFKVLRNLVKVSQPKQLVDLLGAGMMHSNWRVREEVINALIMVMLLPGSRDGLNYAGIFRLLSMAVADPKERVKAVGLEGMAVLARCTGRSEVSSLLAQGGVGLGSEACAQVNSRLANPELPSLGADGVVQHIMEPGPDTLDSISSDLPPSRRMGLAPLQQAQPRPFPLHQLPLPQPLQPPTQQQQGMQQLPLMMSLQHGKLPWQAPAMPRPRLRPEAVTVKHTGLEGTAGSPGTLSNNGGVQVSPSSSCASPDARAIPVWPNSPSKGGSDHTGSNSPDHAPAQAPLHSDATTTKEGENKAGAAEGGTMGSLARSSFGRYASSNLKAAAQSAQSSQQGDGQQQQRQQSFRLRQGPPHPSKSRQASPPTSTDADLVRASSCSPPPDSGVRRPVKSEQALDESPSSHRNGGVQDASQRGGLEGLGNLQGGRALNSLPLGVLDGGHHGDSSSALAQGAPPAVSLSTSFADKSSPGQPHLPGGDKDAMEAGGGVPLVLRPRRGLRSPPSNLQSSTDVTASYNSSNKLLGLGHQQSGGSRGALSGLSNSISSHGVVSAARGELDQSAMSMRDLMRGREGDGAGAAPLQPEQHAGNGLLLGSRAGAPGSGSNVSLSGLAALKHSRQTLASRALEQGQKDMKSSDALLLRPHKMDGLAALKVEPSGGSTPSVLPSRAQRTLMDLAHPQGPPSAELSKLRQLSSHQPSGRVSPPPAVPAKGLANMRPSMLSLAGPQGNEGHPEDVEDGDRASSAQHASDSVVAGLSWDQQARSSLLPGHRASVLGPCQSPMPHAPSDRNSNSGVNSLVPSCSEVPDLAPQAATPYSVHDTGAAEYLDMLRGNDGRTSNGTGTGQVGPHQAHTRDKAPLQLAPGAGAGPLSSGPVLRRISPPGSALRPTGSLLSPGAQPLHGQPHQQQQQQQQLGGPGPRPNLWLHSPAEEEVGARPETFSPNKVELLANLKRRQIEKRAPSSQLPSRKASTDGEVPELPVQGLSTFTEGLHHHSEPLAQGLQGHSPWGTFGAFGGGGGLGRGVPPLGQRKVQPLAPQQPPHPLLPPWISSQLEGGGVGQELGGGQPQGRKLTSEGSDSSAGQGSGIAGGIKGGLRALGSAGMEALKGKGRALLGSRGRAGQQQLPQQQQQVPEGPEGASGNGAAADALADNATAAHNQPDMLTAQHLGLHRISTQRASSTGLASAGSAPPIPNQAAGGPLGAVPGGLIGSSAAAGAGSGSNCASPAYAARTRLAPAMFERLKLRSADMPHPHHSGGGAVSTPTAATQPNTPASAAEGIGYSPLSSAKSATGGGFWEKSMKPLEELSAAELTPLPEPEKSLRSAINKMMQANNADRKELDWQGQHEAINDSRRIVAHHPEVLRPCLHEFVRAAVPALDQLRSFTVKNAIALMQEMFVALGRQMDRELDDIVPMLLKKAGEISNAGRENFLATEADRALAEMSRRVSEHRAVAALCACANHKSMHVRAKVSSHLDGMMEQPNVRAVLASNQQCLERLFKVAAGFLNEGGLETRTYGKRILFNIKMCQGGKADLDRLVSQVHPEMLARKVSDVVDNLNSLPPVPCTAAARGAAGVRLLPLSRQASGGSSGPSFTAGYPPSPAFGYVGGVVSSANGGSSSGGILSGPALQDAASTQAHHNQERGKHSISAPIGGSGGGGPPLKAGGHFGLRGPSSSNGRDSNRSRAAAAAQAGGLITCCDGSTAMRAAPPKPAPAEGFDLDQQEALSKILAGLGARDFKEKIEVLKSLETMAQQQQLAAAPEAQLVELLDSMTARISEGNAKVAIQALETVRALFYSLRGRCNVGLNTLIPALAATLGSSNDKIRSVGVKATDALVEAVDPVLLIQNFAHCASHSSVRGRPLLVERLLVLARALWPARPTLVVKHALPAAFSLLNDTKGDGRAAANTLLMGLARLMGPQLLEHAVGLQPVLQQRVGDAVALAANNQ